MAREITGPMRESTIARIPNGHIGKLLYKHLHLYHRLRHLSTLIEVAYFDNDCVSKQGLMTDHCAKDE